VLVVSLDLTTRARFRKKSGGMRHVRYETSKEECIARHKFGLAVEFDEGSAHAARR
jgi:hypothetical protein